MEIKGCQNHGCVIEEPKGMATNGRCRCLDEISERIADSLDVNRHVIRSILTHSVRYFRKKQSATTEGVSRDE